MFGPLSGTTHSTTQSTGTPHLESLVPKPSTGDYNNYAYLSARGTWVARFSHLANGLVPNPTQAEANAGALLRADTTWDSTTYASQSWVNQTALNNFTFPAVPAGTPADYVLASNGAWDPSINELKSAFLTARHSGTVFNTTFEQTTQKIARSAAFKATFEGRHGSQYSTSISGVYTSDGLLKTDVFGTPSTTGTWRGPQQTGPSIRLKWVNNPQRGAYYYIPWDQEPFGDYGGGTAVTQQMVWLGVVNGAMHNYNLPLVNTLNLAATVASYPSNPKPTGIVVKVAGLWQFRVRVRVVADLSNTTGRTATNTPPFVPSRKWRGTDGVDHQFTWDYAMKYEVRLALERETSSTPHVRSFPSNFAETLETFEVDECPRTLTLTTTLMCAVNTRISPLWSASIEGVRLLNDNAASENEFSGELIYAT